jgi:hypothetical protein
LENQLFVGLSIQNRIGKSSTTNHAKRRNQVSLTRTQPKNNQSRENFGMQHLENIIMSGGILLKCRGHLLTLHISGLLGIVCFFCFVHVCSMFSFLFLNFGYTLAMHTGKGPDSTGSGKVFTESPMPIRKPRNDREI